MFKLATLRRRTLLHFPRARLDWSLSHRYNARFIRALAMKRKASNPGTNARAQRRKESEMDYCDVTPQIDALGRTIWPASFEAVEAARDFIRDWYVVLLHLGLANRLSKESSQCGWSSQSTYSS
jgi:hypothetical protein